MATTGPTSLLFSETLATCVAYKSSFHAGLALNTLGKLAGHAQQLGIGIEIIDEPHTAGRGGCEAVRDSAPWSQCRSIRSGRRGASDTTARGPVGRVIRLDRFGLVPIERVRAATRIACLTHPGINQLQQRLVFHQTRLEVPLGQFQAAFDHTYEEADLLEEWVTDLDGDEQDVVAAFESWLREGEPSRQQRLVDRQERAPIRREMREEIERRGA